VTLSTQSGIVALTRRASAAAERIRDWLLSPAVQLRDGIQAGGVAGSLAADGRPRYVYPEITGYFLHWLAESSLADGGGDGSAAAAAANDWTARQLAGGAVPRTRSYLDAEEPADWRNDAAFFFDLAMLLRGLSAAAQARLIATPRTLLACLIEQLGRFVDAAGSMRAMLPLRADAPLPQRWSTRAGPFEVKAAARVLLTRRLVALPANLEAACTRLIEEFAPQAREMSIGMLHPTLYFAEGMLVARPRDAVAVGLLLQRILRLRQRDGSLPEAETGSTVPRSDIVAQALRVGLLLRAQGVESAPADDTLAALAVSLLSRVGADGSVCFRSDATAPEANVWCALFAEQALRWFSWSCDGHPLPEAQWLV
jgi:hypothetical protein